MAEFRYTLDQLEFHNIRHLSYLFYRKTILAGLEFVLLCQKLLKFLARQSYLLQASSCH